MGATLILASASPRRRDLLAAQGVRFEVVPSAVDETPLPGEPPEAFAQRLAREKACDVARQRPGRCVLAADTVVIAGATLFGKPAGRDDARRMLRALSGRTHRVLTAVALVDGDGHILETAVESEVEFRQLTAGEIEAYLDSDEPFDKAGAYAIQGLAQKFVTGVRGSYSNVIGLPMDEVLELLRRHCPPGMTTGASA
jgi:septum formation protein